MKKALPFIIVILVAVAIGWFLGKQNQSSAPETIGENVETVADEHSHGDHDHGDHATHDHSPSTLGNSPNGEDKELREPPASMAKKMAEAYRQSEKIRVQNETILAELLTTDEVRAMYKERLNNADLSLYGDDGSRLNEDEYVAKWIADQGIETEEMVAAMDDAAQQPIDNILSQQDRVSNSTPDELQTPETAEERAASEQRRQEHRRAEIETIRNELLTRSQIETLYDERLAEGNPEIISPDGQVVPKSEYVSGFIETYGELTPELDKILTDKAEGK